VNDKEAIYSKFVMLNNGKKQLFDN